MSPIRPISTEIAIPLASPDAAPSSSGEFKNLLSDSIGTMEQLGAQSGQAVQQFLSGESDDIHKVAIASQRADLSSELFMQVKNKVVSAYQEIMRMQM